MARTYFVMITTDPEIDPRKCVVGMACALQAAKKGHDVNLFFASHAVRLLQSAVIDEVDSRAGEQPGTARNFLESLGANAASMHCSAGSQAVVGITLDNAEQWLVGGFELQWSGPSTVIELSDHTDVVLSF